MAGVLYTTTGVMTSHIGVISDHCMKLYTLPVNPTTGVTLKNWPRSPSNSAATWKDVAVPGKEFQLKRI